MAFYDKFPYTNFQELNLDWLTQEVSKVRDNRNASDASAAAALASEKAAKASETAAAASQQAAANSETAAAGSEAASAEYLAQIGTHTAGAVADWLKENLSPTTPPIDATLTVSGAAADAKKTGDEITDLKNTLDKALPHVYESIDVTTKSGVYDKNFTLITGDAGYLHAMLSVLPGQKYKISAWKYSNYYPAVLFAKNDVLVSYDNTPAASEVFTDLEVTVPIDADTMIINGHASHGSGITVKKFITQKCASESDVNQLTEYMPYDYVPQSVTLTKGLVNKWNEVSGPHGWSYGKISVVSGENYKVSGNYFGGNYPAYLILKSDTVLTFYNPASTGAFNDIEITIPENATDLIVNGNTDASVTIKKYQMVPVPNKAVSYDSILVGKTDKYAYNNINDAVMANSGSIISVDYGTYDTEIKSLATDKTVIGKDRNLCILSGKNRDYDTPPIETAGGIIKHFTVTMENASDASHGGYCLHSDTNACIGKTLIVEDCKFSCIGQHTVGLGVWQNENVLFKDCEFISINADSMPLFAHNSGTSDGVAVMRFHNCIFRGTGYALKLSSYSSNCTIRLEFIDCTFESENYTGNDMIWTDYVTGDTHDQSNLHNFRGKLPLLKTSHGNNVQIANYSA